MGCFKERINNTWFNDTRVTEREMARKTPQNALIIMVF